jgi:hypothetical protein
MNPSKNRGVNSAAREELAVLPSHVTPVVLLLNDTNIMCWTVVYIVHK